MPISLVGGGAGREAALPSECVPKIKSATLLPRRSLLLDFNLPPSLDPFSRIAKTAKSSSLISEVRTLCKKLAWLNKLAFLLCCSRFSSRCWCSGMYDMSMKAVSRRKLKKKKNIMLPTMNSKFFVTGASPTDPNRNRQTTLRKMTNTSCIFWFIGIRS